MTILHAHSTPQFTEHLRSVLAEANGQSHSVDIAVGYFYLSGFTQVADLLAKRPGRVRILIGRTDRPTREEIVAGYNPRESTDDYHAAQNRRDEATARDETLDNVGRNAAAQTQDDASEAGIKSLAQLIVDGTVDVRAYVKDRMHAKAYIGYTGLESASRHRHHRQHQLLEGRLHWQHRAELPRNPCRRHQRNPRMVRTPMARERISRRQSR